MRVQMEMSERQAKIMIEALDLLSRIGTGQVDAIEQMLFKMGIMPDMQKRNEAEDALKQLKSAYFPALQGNASYGIFNEQTPDESKVSWDMIQVARNKIAWHKNPKGGFTVDFNTPMPSTNTEELIRVDIISEEK
ncbi:hypothetical protein PP175_28340 (plasmid) [Aneurinibacillus sp. Ricciae_BoGa-3]|uniref:hypothetical protein n=1 Tax=Aneurinibacillus sp. Ricciae_BoGa-3 TaxID=3022697 RepID=UPI0023405C4F|nr:hypothetical protein [Aneurinibacillus sp. Ricciae_BoGa-3]WCK57101.1 hypothetical protein PP175_28340 [Aneurinibacillus sp. Ricciae_BoGa-3]